jgi:16S rRNA (guanine527-N7)-methyltransferase
MINSNVSRETLEKLSSYVELIEKWNSHINLVSRKLHHTKIINHIKEAISLGDILNKNITILDVGSGNGIPGIILGIMGFKCILIERNSKKAVFLKEAARILNLDVKVIDDDIKECYTLLKTIKIDVITSKAVSDSKGILDLCKPILNESMVVYLFKKNSMLDEITLLKENYNFEFVVIENKIADDNVLFEFRKVQYKNEI